VTSTSWPQARQTSPGNSVRRMATGQLARATMRAVSVRLLPFMFVMYLFSYLDRLTVAIDALQNEQRAAV
jgi:hypothetical protein